MNKHSNVFTLQQAMFAEQVQLARKKWTLFILLHKDMTHGWHGWQPAQQVMSCAKLTCQKSFSQLTRRVFVSWEQNAASEENLPNWFNSSVKKYHPTLGKAISRQLLKMADLFIPCSCKRSLDQRWSTSVFCSTGLPLTRNRWVQQHFQATVH